MKNDDYSCMICFGCGFDNKECDAYCVACGRALRDPPAGYRFPENLSEIASGMRSAVEKTDITSRDGSGRIIIKTTGDVSNVPLNLKGDVKIVSAGDVSFAGPERYVLELTVNGEVCAEAVFTSEAAVLREWGDDRNIAVYTDVFGYHIRSDVLSEVDMRVISRKPVVFICSGNRFFLSCENGDGYIKADGRDVEGSRITEIAVNERISVGQGSSVRIRC